MEKHISVQLSRLLETLSIPTYFGQEEQLINYLIKRLKQLSVNFEIDKYGTIYVTKGISEIYPCVVAHTDTVHPIENYFVNFTKDNENIYATKPNGDNTGIGGDNKAGVFVCLELIEKLDVIKSAFFVGEEFGCFGSQLANKDFFTNVGYAIQFDAPENDWISHISDGVELFDPEGDFFIKIKNIFIEGMGYPIILGNHPYTDVAVLKRNYDFSCINYSVGYHNMHTNNEYVNINECLNALDMAEKIIKNLGYTKYLFINKEKYKEIDKTIIEERFNKIKKRTY